MFEIIIVLGFLIFIYYREQETSDHIKDLELRLFAKNKQDYLQDKFVSKKVPPPHKPDEEPDQLDDPMEISPEEALKAIEKGIK